MLFFVMREIIVLAALTASCSPLSAGTQYFGQAIPVCNLVSDQQTYAGHRVLVSGVYYSTPHGGMLRGPDCDRSVKLNGSLDVPDDKRTSRVIEAAFIRNEFAQVPVVVSGVFQPSERWENGQYVRKTGPSIEETAFVAARQP
jgi:hypothetical protein